MQGKHTAGEGTTFMSGSYDIALVAAGAAIEACRAVLAGKVRHAYALTRPPGASSTQHTSLATSLAMVCRQEELRRRAQMEFLSACGW